MMKAFQRNLVFAMLATFFVGVGFVLALTIVPVLTGQSAAAIDDVEPPQIGESQLLRDQERVYNAIYENLAPSVVSITILRQASDGQNLPVSSGSGFVIDTDGHIVTNNHVVAAGTNMGQTLSGSTRIEISMFDGTITEAEIVGTDPDSDIAVIKVDLPADRLPPVAFGDSESLEEGQMVFAIGNPFSNDWTLTSGIVSALNRSIPGLDRFNIGGVIQTDAAINPGNSGGPLVNLDGEVIGVNSQIESGTRSNSGVGFAVPSNLVLKVAESLIENGSMEYSFLGITSTSMSLPLIEAYDLPNNLRGVVVTQVTQGTAADRAGLRPMTASRVDVITAIDGRPINDFDDLIGYLGIHTNPGDTVTLTVYRGGDVVELSTTLTARPG